MLYPIYLNLTRKHVVVIGGGEVAERKVDSLLDAGALITLISPEVTARLESLANSKRIDFHRRPYARGDCAGAALVFSATDDSAVSRAVWEEATTARVMINTADEPGLCDFMMPAVIRRGDLTVAISTGGASPALAARLRVQLSELLGPEYESLTRLLAEVRPEIRRRVQRDYDRKALHNRILDSDVIALLQRKDDEGAARRVYEIIEAFACEEKS